VYCTRSLGAETSTDIIIVGGGAAGLATAIFTRERNPRRSVLLLDGAPRLGAKILVSGGSRCNVTNTVVTERDYWGGPRPIVRRVLNAFPAPRAAAFFADAGVPLHEEADGKLFPDSNRSRDVLNALLARASRAGVDIREAHRVTTLDTQSAPFVVSTARASFTGTKVVLATGGQSLPKSGSDGAGYAFARALGHRVIETTPALAPLILDGRERGGVHAGISGVSVDAVLTLWIGDAVAIRIRGALLWTHFGISGPAALNVSRHWLRARIDNRPVRLTASFVPEWDFQRTDEVLVEGTRSHPRASIGSVVATLVPASMAEAMLAHAGKSTATPMAELQRDDRRTIVRLLTEWPLPVVDSRGYSYAEATAGGVDLREIDPATMESRVRPGLFLVGEILDVDGRLGGFNFQWAWSSAYVAARALAR
jgi:predicted Rossmann fold flavoprotein